MISAHSSCSSSVDSDDEKSLSCAGVAHQTSTLCGTRQFPLNLNLNHPCLSAHVHDA